MFLVKCITFCSASPLSFHFVSPSSLISSGLIWELKIEKEIQYWFYGTSKRFPIQIAILMYVMYQTGFPADCHFDICNVSNRLPYGLSFWRMWCISNMHDSPQMYGFQPFLSSQQFSENVTQINWRYSALDPVYTTLVLFENGTSLVFARCQHKNCWKWWRVLTAVAWKENILFHAISNSAGIPTLLLI